MSRDKKDSKFNTVKFVITCEVYPDILQEHFKETFKGLNEIQGAVSSEFGWLQQSGIHLTQIRVKG